MEDTMQPAVGPRLDRPVGPLAPTRAEPISCEALLPDTPREVLVWRDGAAFNVLGGRWQISKCRLTRSGPRWECDEPGYWPIPPSLMRRVTHWMELPERPNVNSTAEPAA